MKKNKTEFIVGIFILLGLLSFGYIAINLGGLNFFGSNEYLLTAKFNSVSGLKDGAPIEIAGVKVGKIEKIILSGAQAKVFMRISNKVKLETDSIAAIRTQGLIGQKYIKITNGADEEYLKNNGEIDDTESSVDIEEMIGKFMYKK